MPRASVIISTYNWSSVLPFSIASALEQTEQDLEILVVGDACTDDSEQVVRAVGDPRVHWFNISERFGHQAGPNNEGLQRAAGECIFYLNHDDVWLPHHVEKFLEVFDRGADVVYGMTAILHTEGEVRLAPEYPTPYRRGMWTPPTVLAHRSSVVDKIGGWGDYRVLPMSPENDLVGRALDAGFRLEFCPRLTAVKVPAALRPEVYHTKPNHEQRAWLERIRSDDELEARLLGELLKTRTVAPQQPTIFAEGVRLLKRIVRLVIKRRQPKGFARMRIDNNKRYKGSDP